MQTAGRNCWPGCWTSAFLQLTYSALG